MTSDYNQHQMQQLSGIKNIIPVYLLAFGDYWINQEEFCKNFRAVPLDHAVVIHVQFEGLSLTNSGVVAAVEKILTETGRTPDSVYIFSPNYIQHDAPWTNLFWRHWKVSDEFERCINYWVPAKLPTGDFKTWAMFVGRRTTPRLLALYDIWSDCMLKQNCLISVMNHSEPDTIQIYDQPGMIYDQLDEWLPIQNDSFKHFCNNIPFGSVDGYSIKDQYISPLATGPRIENRNTGPGASLINLGDRYLFEITFETMTRGTTFTPSEKTIRTIMAQKPHVVYAPPNFLSWMQQHGFRTFDKLWDESYDTLEGLPRYRAIMKIIREISELPRAEQLKLHESGQIICQHNYHTLIKIAAKSWWHSPPPMIKKISF